jgi:putative FmdB family regulatory protein
MPTYAFQCSKNHEFEKVLKIDNRDSPTKCPICKCKGKRIIAPSVREPSFTEKLYGVGGYFDPNLNEHIYSPEHRRQVMEKLNVTECRKDKHTTRKQEEYLMKHRANSPFLKFYD